MSSYHHQLASPWPEDPQLEGLILGIVPEDVRTVGGIPLKNCLRNLFETAVRLGFKYGQGYKAPKPAPLELRLKEWRAGEEVRHQQELEAERVWGFDVGWKLHTELSQTRASEASAIPSFPSTCSLSIVAVQTDTVDVAVIAVPLDWAEDAAATLPISAPHSPPPSPSDSPRDFSVLSTGAPKPFASLQRRRRRSPQLHFSSQSHSSHPTRPRKGLACSVNPRNLQHPWRFAPPCPVYSSPIPSRQQRAQLDWDRDPRLRDLGQALTDLGWVRP
ncbi:hypothetical protein B0H19DRAFT_1058252 [Mycena capillaripes]|nr:hypothetical protein B0H19DRAFT_1058252 [Mycena capillaripes]